MWSAVDTAQSQNRRELVVSSKNGFDERIYALKQLHYLDISNVFIPELSERLGSLSELSKLSLQHDKIRSIPGAFGSLVSLKFVDISHNDISDLPSTIFDDLVNLETLNIDFNQLTELPPLQGLINLHRLSVSNNKLSTFPESIIECSKVMNIDLSHNELSELPDSLKWSNLNNLQYFCLDSNKLSVIPSALSSCKKLRELKFKENPIADARLKKLAYETHTGPALMKYLAKSQENNKQQGKRKQAELANTTGSRKLNAELVDTNYVTFARFESPTLNHIKMGNPEGFAQSLRPNILACVVSGVCLDGENVLKDLLRFQTRLHVAFGDQRKTANACLHDFKSVEFPLDFSLMPVEDVNLHPLNMKKRWNGIDLLLHFRMDAEGLRKHKKATNFGPTFRYLESISPRLGPGRDHGVSACEIQPLPVTRDAHGEIISLHPIIGSQCTRLTKDTTEVFIEVTGQSDESCKSIIRGLICWFVQHARPDVGRPISIQPIDIVNSDGGGLLARYPTPEDGADPQFFKINAK